MSSSPFAPRAEVLRQGRERARTGVWRGDPAVASLLPLPDAPVLSESFVRHCVGVLAARGVQRVVTGALAPAEQASFLAAGFEVEARLHLLGVDLGPRLPPVPGGARLARAGLRRRPEVLDVDGAAFPPFWRFDEGGLRDALAATPRVRHRVALGSDGRVIGYAICGRAGRRGFVQRLAVAPGEQRGGTGRRLLLDGLHWLRRRGAGWAVVNTQVDNAPALALYRSLGFRDEPGGLSVLSLALPVPAGSER